ncbi:hypothetical protein O3M35_000584 [Rhynocoris fuscipes]|uniref:DRBM domain-containing protein n=1 Tax=Rhynocoris fuscipes TaxID=488301 RepID=A0AAW1DQ25_9HEMI
MDKTPVTMLQELLIKKQLIPTYNIIFNGAGTHDPLFKYEVAACGASAVGSGKSKKEAKHEAARLLLEKLVGESPGDVLDANVNSPYAEVIKDNAVGMLAEFCGEKNLPQPKYDLVRDEGLPHAKLFSFKCSVSSFTTEAEARTKKQAKQLAANEMLNKLKECVQNVPTIKKMDKEDFQKSNEVVIKKLMDIRLKKGNTSEQLGIKIADYYKIFLNESYACKSTLLQEIKGRNRSYFEALDDPEVVCKNILKELDFQYKLEEVPTTTSAVAVALTLEGTPTWTFFGCDPDAIRDVFIEALSFMADMIE